MNFENLKEIFDELSPLLFDAKKEILKIKENSEELSGKERDLFRRLNTNCSKLIEDLDNVEELPDEFEFEFDEWYDFDTDELYDNSDLFDDDTDGFEILRIKFLEDTYEGDRISIVEHGLPEDYNTYVIACDEEDQEKLMNDIIRDLDQLIKTHRKLKFREPFCLAFKDIMSGKGSIVKSLHSSREHSDDWEYIIENGDDV